MLPVLQSMFDAAARDGQGEDYRYRGGQFCPLIAGPGRLEDVLGLVRHATGA